MNMAHRSALALILTGSFAAAMSAHPARAGESIVYAFQGGSDGSYPTGALIEVDGILYGVTQVGGAHDKGTVFSLTPFGTKTTLYSFKGGTDGEQPSGGLVQLGGKLYGVTRSGGTSSGCTEKLGCGTVFSVTTGGAEKIVASFATDSFPVGGLAAMNGTLYGLTYESGSNSDGSFYALTPGGQMSTVFSFGPPGKTNTSGAFPATQLTPSNGVFYGTTRLGGAHNYGVIYTLSPAGAQTILFNFPGLYNPYEVTPAYGTVFGTTLRGGSAQEGIAYKLNATGHLKKLHSFGTGTDGLYSSPLLLVGDTFYAVAGLGGTDQDGILYSLTKNGIETVLYNFTGGNDAIGTINPLLNVAGTLYSVTGAGGGSGNCNAGCGTVFAYTP